jgi:hypothetical protein
MKMKISFAVAAVMGLIFIMLVPYAARSYAEGIAISDKNFKNGTAELNSDSDKLSAEAAAVKTDAKAPSVFLPVKSWEFEPVVDGVEVVHDFVVQNKGTAALNIERVKTG